MNRLRLSTGLLVILAVGASVGPRGDARSLVIVEFTAELRLADVEFPVTDSGNVTFRACTECESGSMPVTPETRYLAAGNDLTRSEFLADVTRIRLTQAGNLTTMIGLTYDAESRLVTRISLHEDALSAD